MTFFYEKPAILHGFNSERHHLIEASAGTGKTYTIEHLVIELILQGVPMPKILVVTFTEKATGELKRRIRGLLHKLTLFTEESEAPTDLNTCWRLDETAKHRLETALLEIDEASIDTIHAYCNRILNEFAFENGRLLEMEQVDTHLMFEDLFFEYLRTDLLSKDVIGQSILKDYLEENPEGLIHLKSGRYKKPLTHLAGELVRKKALFLPDEEACKSAFESWHAGFLARDRQACLDELDRLNIHGGSLKSIKKLFVEMMGVFSDGGLGWIKGLSWFNQQKKSDRKTNKKKLSPANWKFNAKPKPGRINSLEQVSSELVGLFEGAASLLAYACPVEAFLLKRIVPGLRKLIREEKERRGWYDFDDMISMVAEGLRDPNHTALLDSLRGKHGHALIDEFQDTDEDQWTIFSTVFLKSDDHRLYLIGDPKQAIYGWRGADIHTYLRARDEIRRANGLVHRLQKNYRSSPGMVHGINRIFGHESLFQGEVRYDRKILPGLETRLIGEDGPAIRCLQLEPEADETLSSMDERNGFGYWIADEIATLLRREDLRPPDEERIQPKHIAVLVRSRFDAEHLGKILAEYDVPFAFYKQAGLFQTREAHDFYDLLYAIENHTDEAAAFKALLTRFFHVELNELLRIPVLPDAYRASLAEWRQSIYRYRDFRSLFNTIFSETKIFERLLFTRDAEREVTNYEHISDILKREGMGLDLKQLLRVLKGYMNSGAGVDQDLLRLETEKEAVQIMTIHAAKGLEFPIVFVHRANSSKAKTKPYNEYHDPDRGRVIDLAKNHDDAEAKELRDENERLAYVALTRAKYQLILTHPPLNGEANATGSVLESSLKALRQEGLQSDIRFETRVYAGPPQKKYPASDRDATSPGPNTSIGVSTLDYRALLEERNRLHMTSYTRLAHRQAGESGLSSGAPGGLWRYDETVATGLQETTTLPKGKDTGICLHEILERTPELKVSEYAPNRYEDWSGDPDVSGILKQGLKPFGLEKHQDSVSWIIWKALTTELLKGIAVGALSDKDRLHEIDFHFPIESSRGETMFTGSIDLAFRRDDRFYFADWKTDTLEDYRTPALRKKVRADYWVQVQIYLWAMLRWLRIEDKTDYEARFGGMFYLFLRGFPSERGVYFHRPSWDEVQGFMRELARSA